MLRFRYQLHNILCYFNTLVFFSPPFFLAALHTGEVLYKHMLVWNYSFSSIFFGRGLLAHDTALRAINRSCDTDVHCLYNLSHIKQLP